MNVDSRYLKNIQDKKESSWKKANCCGLRRLVAAPETSRGGKVSGPVPAGASDLIAPRRGCRAQIPLAHSWELLVVAMHLQLLVVGLCAAAGALKLPSYITPCRYDDPELDACALREARKALKTVVGGDRKYRIPNLEPLLIQELKVDQSNGGRAIGFSFVAYNCSMSGLSDVTVHAVRLDLKARHVEYDLEFPRLEVKADYTANGKVLLLPITGTGKANITIVDAKATYRYNYTLHKKADGDYSEITDNKLDFRLDGRAHVHLDNLFNGDQVLADNINEVLNDNWQDLVRDVGPAIAEALGQLIKLVLGGMFDTVSMQEAFPGHPSS
ncbi:protein takeout-like [Bacillus rossius redtenbacheri]|uniref:protein takeout-like n=1 Tax=Bacillus rossius redtenbacheri TaxID=93214 RepID=UPI002FDE6DB2